ncbi:FAD-dependent oxidoreductase [Marinobacterium mangrovicola]|uniref:Salicylate hydroxylase n=1 Tax=Marinobacterium mangrovicola TaxID=1476959 RepID=A0A4R1G4P6_9GAMM|nr:NAD(P)/FAD-dependent oxidoreductase [Marinobacterium mangrovicola]TCK02947.1 salicylate hydroxylase [Marinobacterium mangrovicola]
MKPEALKDLNVAVIGAGYAGATTAYALHLMGAKVTVYEQAQEVKEVGAGIGLRPSTMDQFRQLGIFDAIDAVTSPSDYFEILTADSQRIAMEEWPEKDAFSADTHFVHRGDFIDALLNVLPAGMVKLGHRLSKIIDNGSSATAVFDNGVTVNADLIVGADGIRSQVRNQLFSDKPPVFAGEHAYRVVIPMADTYGLVDDGNLRMYMGRGTKIYLLPLLHRNEVSFDVTCLATDSTPAPVSSKEQLLKVVEGFDQRLIDITEGLDMDQVNLRAVYDIDPVDNWHSNSVVLVGDAAHAMCHHQGQGANSAVLDAGALADSLKEANSVSDALSHYQANRKPVTDVLQHESRQGWSEDEVNDVFPNQHQGQIAARS